MTKLDERDIQILAILQREGRITKTALAKRVYLSPTPCWERIKRLEEMGIIEGYGANLSLAAFRGHTLVLMEAELDSHHAADFEHFESAVQSMNEVLECWAVGGGIDYVLKIVAESVDSYQRFVDRLLAADIGLKRYFTYVVTKRIKETRVLPEYLLRQLN